LTNINQWASWQQDISAPYLQGKPSAGSIFTWKTGGAKITSMLHTVEPYCKFCWTGKTLGMFAIHNWTLRANGNQTEVVADESMQGLLTISGGMNKFR
jgi:hypothetical protein